MTPTPTPSPDAKTIFLKAAAAGLLAMDQCSEQYDQAFPPFAKAIPGFYREPLHQLVHGPVEDGDVISKMYRDNLIDLKLAVRVCVKGEQGYTAATYLGWAVHKYQEANL